MLIAVEGRLVWLRSDKYTSPLCMFLPPEGSPGRCHLHWYTIKICVTWVKEGDGSLRSIVKV